MVMEAKNLRWNLKRYYIIMLYADFFLDRVLNRTSDRPAVILHRQVFEFMEVEKKLKLPVVLLTAV